MQPFAQEPDRQGNSRDELLLISGRLDDLSFSQKLDEWKLVPARFSDEQEAHPYRSCCAKDAKLAVNVLLIDPSSNKLFGVTGLRVFFEATL